MSRNECISVVMNTSIGSDGERSECDSRPCSMDSANSNQSSMNSRDSSKSAHIINCSNNNNDNTTNMNIEKVSSNPKKRRLLNENEDGSLDFSRKLKFSVENILKPDFGRSRANVGHVTIDTRQSDSPVNNNNGPSERFSNNSDLRSPISGNQSGKGQDFGGPSSLNIVTNGASPATSPNKETSGTKGGKSQSMVWPAWVYCTRYSDRPSSGPRCRRLKKKNNPEEKRPRTAFTTEQLARLKKEFQENRYLTEKRRQELSNELDLNESQIKIWFQNKRAKIKKQTGPKNALAYHLFSQGLYNHSTVSILTNSPPSTDDDEDNGKSICGDEPNLHNK